jgi:hypothetical protein
MYKLLTFCYNGKGEANDSSDAGSGYCKLKNKKNGMLFEVNGYSITDGANIIQYLDNGGVNQQWQLVQ